MKNTYMYIHIYTYKKYVHIYIYVSIYIHEVHTYTIEVMSSIEKDVMKHQLDSGIID
jgi:hypothetical protein